MISNSREWSGFQRWGEGRPSECPYVWLPSKPFIEKQISRSTLPWRFWLRSDSELIQLPGRRIQGRKSKQGYMWYLGQFYIHNIQKMAIANQSLNSHTQLQSIQNCYAKFAWPILKNSYFFFHCKGQCSCELFYSTFLL